MQNEYQDEASSSCSNFKKSTQFFIKFSLLPCFGLTLYVMDMLSDVNAAYWDYQAGDETFAYITIGLVFAPGLLFALYASSLYVTTYMGEIACLKAPFVLILSPLLPVWVIIRDISRVVEGLIATLFPRRREELVEKRQKPSKIYLLKFLEAFTEAAPQLLLRLYIVALRHPVQFSDMRTSEIIQISFSVFVLSLKVVSTHQKSVSTQQVLEGETEIDSNYILPWFIQVLALAWWMCFLLTRFEALALFSASYGCWVLLVIGIHVLLLALFQKLSIYKDNIRKFFIYLFGSFVFIFAYVQFNLETRIKISAWFPYTVFSIIVFIENSIMLTFWQYDQRTNSDFLLNNGSIFINNDSTSNFTATTLASLVINGTESSPSSMGPEYLFTEGDLRTHWKRILFVHYGVFALGMFAMILTFCTSSIVNNDPNNSKLNREETYELQTLNSPS